MVQQGSFIREISFIFYNIPLKISQDGDFQLHFFRKKMEKPNLGYAHYNPAFGNNI